MKKFLAILYAFLIIGAATTLVWLLYSNFPSTVVVIFNIFIMMVGVSLGIVAYKKTLNKKPKRKIQLNSEGIPSIERGLIQVQPGEFAEKLEKYRGKLFLIDPDLVEEDIMLVRWEFNKLTDELRLQFSNGLKTRIIGPSELSVGSYQFMLFKFETIIHSKGKNTIILQWKGHKLYQVKKGQEVPLDFPRNLPVYLFDWRATTE